MISISDYDISAQLYEDNRSIILRVRKISDDTPVILKLLYRKYPTNDELKNFRNEYDMLRSLEEHRDIIRAFDMKEYGSSLRLNPMVLMLR